jgi:hypothetical protein
MICHYNGKTLDYHSGTKFTVQSGRYTKGSYKTRYSFTGDLYSALMYYEGINIGRGYKKRLVMNDKVIARSFS